MFTYIANFVARWNLVQRFNITGFLIMILGTATIGTWVGEQIKASVINESAATTALYLDSFITPNLQELGQSNSLASEHVETLNRLLRSTDLGRQIVAIKVWGQDGQILYSNSPSLIGHVFTGAEDLSSAWQGRVVATISDLQDDESVEERRLYTRLLEIYIPVRQNGTHKVIAIAEFYQKLDTLEAEIAKAQRQSWFAVGTSMGGIYLLLVVFFQNTRNRIRKQEVALKNQVAQLTEVLSQNDELDQRVRRATANAATLNERLLRRTSAELDGGPVQEISLALLRLDRAINQNEICRPVNPNSKCNENLPIVQTSLQTALQEIRAITSGLGLPQLDGLTLPDIFASAVQTHELRTGTVVTLSMSNLPNQTSLPIKITAYRLVREALNNSHRHAGGAGQEVRVIFKMNQLQIDVSDRGPGFDVTTPFNREEHLGLTGMRERIESMGGLFKVESKINEGTKITARLSLQNVGEHANGNGHPEAIDDHPIFRKEVASNLRKEGRW